jgi:hypothetical protein
MRNAPPQPAQASGAKISKLRWATGQSTVVCSQSAKAAAHLVWLEAQNQRRQQEGGSSETAVSRVKTLPLARLEPVLQEATATRPGCAIGAPA